MTREEVIKLVQDSDLSAAAKNTWISRIREEGLTQSLVNDIKGAFQVEIDTGFQQLGIDISDTPQYKAAEAEMVKEAETANAQFTQAMSAIEDNVAQAQTKALEDIDAIKIQAIKDKIV